MNHFAKLKEQLKTAEFDAILLTCADNRFYASGFASTGTDGVALVTETDAYYFTDFRYIEAANRRIGSAAVRMTERGRGYLTLINEVIDEKGLQRIGYEDADMTVADFRRYEEMLHCTLIPASGWMSGIRAVKDEEELACLTDAQRLAERAFDDVLSEIRPGVTEKEIAALLTYRILHYGAENVSFDPIVVSGANGSMPHGVPGEKKIETGEFVTLDFGALYHGYCSDMTRTVAVGCVTEEMAHVYRTVLDAQLAGIAAARSGVSGHDVDAAARDLIAAAGYGDCFGHSFGHGVGVAVHEAPNAAPSNEKPLPCGAVISAEPGIYLPGKFGVRIEDVIVLTEDGCRDLTSTPKELLIL